MEKRAQSGHSLARGEQRKWVDCGLVRRTINRQLWSSGV
jgi:hypothetical protein